MADSHEEQLLSELLSGIAREDARIDAAYLESRVVAAALTRTIQPGIRSMWVPHWAIAATIAVAVLTTALFYTNSKAVPRTDGSEVAPTEAVIAEEPRGVAPAPPTPPRIVRRRAPVTQSPIAQSPISHQPIAASPIPTSPIAQSPDEFLPLMPMTEQELTGSFQLVRVQMPRASLGALRSPLEHPNELVEADVLLGEDGMARAIRVSTSGSVYPWRSR